MANRKNIYFPDHILEKLRGDDMSLSGRVTEIVDRYFEMLRRIRIEKEFTTAEMNLMKDACRSWLPEPAATVFGGVALEVEDSLPYGLDKKWKVNAKELLAKLEELTPGEEIALVEAVTGR
jgi:hypothetical protein